MALPKKAQEDIDQHIKQLEQALCQLKMLRNSHSPISQLPVELLSKIFVLVSTNRSLARTCDNGYISFPDSLTLCCICRSWRAIALECRDLWKTILIRPTTTTVLMDLLWRRAKVHPLDLIVDGRSSTDPTVASALAPARLAYLSDKISENAGQFRLLSIASSKEGVESLLGRILDGSTFATLIHLGIAAVRLPPSRYLSRQEEPEDSPNLKKLWTCVAPKLRTVFFEKVKVPWDSPIFKAPGLSDVRATGEWPFGGPECTDLFTFLQYPALRLRNLHLTATYDGFFEGPTQQDLCIVLQHAQNVTLSSNAAWFPLSFLKAVRFNPRTLSSFTLKCPSIYTFKHLRDAFSNAFSNIPISPTQMELSMTLDNGRTQGATVAASQSPMGGTKLRTIKLYIGSLRFFDQELLAEKQIWSLDRLTTLSVACHGRVLDPGLWSLFRDSRTLERLFINPSDSRSFLEALSVAQADGMTPMTSCCPFPALRNLCIKGMPTIWRRKRLTCKPYIPDSDSYNLAEYRWPDGDDEALTGIDAERAFALEVVDALRLRRLMVFEEHDHWDDHEVDDDDDWDCHDYGCAFHPLDYVYFSKCSSEADDSFIQRLTHEAGTRVYWTKGTA